jgi:hypothetical protein
VDKTKKSRYLGSQTTVQEKRGGDSRDFGTGLLWALIMESPDKRPTDSN